MFNPVLQTAIRNLEGKAKVATDNGNFHRTRAAEYDAAAHKYIAAIDALREVMGDDPVSPAAEAFAEEEGDDGEEEAPAEPAMPFPHIPAYTPKGSNGPVHRGTVMFDRDAIKRELRARHIHYPLGPSHRGFGTFFRQCLISACVQHPGYGAYLTAGGDSLLANYTKTMPHILQAVTALNVDAQKVEDDAKVLHNLIYTNGVKGKDWK